jgi:hypothetical protein
LAGQESQGEGSLAPEWLQFVVDGPKAGTPEQGPHDFEQAELSPRFRMADGYGRPSTSERITRAEIWATIKHSGVIVNAKGEWR